METKFNTRRTTTTIEIIGVNTSMNLFSDDCININYTIDKVHANAIEIVNSSSAVSNVVSYDNVINNNDMIRTVVIYDGGEIAIVTTEYTTSTNEKQ